MTPDDFELDPRLKADTHHIASLPLCEVMLMNDARFAWLILVPRRAGLVELVDLSEELQQALLGEIHRVATTLRDAVPCDKLNIGALGNIVRQLHIHVIARLEGDAAWPGPVWGSGVAERYAKSKLESRVVLLRNHLIGNSA